jgi:hypothetical protein
MIDRDRMRKAVALSLANDGYIDVDQGDGEAYIYGDERAIRKGEIDAIADSLIKWYGIDQEAAIAEVLTRRRAEGRD